MTIVVLSAIAVASTLIAIAQHVVIRAQKADIDRLIDWATLATFAAEDLKRRLEVTSRFLRAARNDE